MTDERFELGIKILAIASIIFLIAEVAMAIKVQKTKKVSGSILDEIEKDVSDSELLKQQDLNEIDLEDYYVEEE